jgi:hypothetical protein
VRTVFAEQSRIAARQRRQHFLQSVHGEEVCIRYRGPQRRDARILAGIDELNHDAVDSHGVRSRRGTGRDGFIDVDAAGLGEIA